MHERGRYLAHIIIRQLFCSTTVPWWDIHFVFRGCRDLEDSRKSFVAEAFMQLNKGKFFFGLCPSVC